MENTYLLKEDQKNRFLEYHKQEQDDLKRAIAYLKKQTGLEIDSIVMGGNCQFTLKVELVPHELKDKYTFLRRSRLINDEFRWYYPKQNTKKGQEIIKGWKELGLKLKIGLDLLQHVFQIENPAIFIGCKTTFEKIGNDIVLHTAYDLPVLGCDKVTINKEIGIIATWLLLKQKITNNTAIPPIIYGYFTLMAIWLSFLCVVLIILFTAYLLGFPIATIFIAFVTLVIIARILLFIVQSTIKVEGDQQ